MCLVLVWPFMQSNQYSRYIRVIYSYNVTFCDIAFPFSSFQLPRMTEAHFRTPYFNVDSYPRDFLSMTAPARSFIMPTYCRILCTARAFALPLQIYLLNTST